MIPETHPERDIASIISMHNKELPVPLSNLLCEMQWPVTPANQRRMKGIVSRLVNEHDLPILSSRKDPAGYYWARSTADLEDGVKADFNQAIGMLRRVRRLLGAARWREWCGQENLFGGPDQSIGLIHTQEKRL